jgi:hypothetical protein
MRSILALVLAVSLFVSPLAMAGGLNSSDSGFLFSKDQVSSITISDQEMQNTEGKLLNNLSVLNLLGITAGTVSGNDNIFCLNLLAGCSFVSVSGG